MTAPRGQSKEFDLTIFGASGFVGRLIVDYLVAHAPPEVRLAIAGRDRRRLEQLRAGLRREVGIVLADVADPGSLAEMAAATRVVLTTVGPYARFGEPVVRACVEHGADCLDLTGEPNYVDDIIAAHDEAARARGVLVLPCCGFECVPTDLGVLATVRALPRDRPATISGYMEGRGSFSGGTIASALGVMSSPRRRRGAEGGRGGSRPHLHFQPALKRWGLPFPTIEPQIVRRSAGLRGDYGPGFTYEHYIALPRLYHVGFAALGLGAIAALARIAAVRSLVTRLRPPGSGPDAGERARSWFKLTFVGRAGDACAITEVSGGDPGYGETAKIAGETALCVALQRDMLFKTGGVCTTAAACGELLIARLQAAGLGFTTRPG